MFEVMRPATGPIWKAVEDDFVLGTCSRSIFGFAARGPEGEWTAFDDASQVIGVFTGLDQAEAQMWLAHRGAHAAEQSTAWAAKWAGLARRLHLES